VIYLTVYVPVECHACRESRGAVFWRDIKTFIKYSEERNWSWSILWRAWTTGKLRQTLSLS